MKSFMLYFLVSLLGGSYYFNKGTGVGDAKIVIDNGAVSLYGNQLNSDWSYTTFSGALGKEDRKDGGFFTYDKIGIHMVGFKEDSAYTITEFHITFSDDKDNNKSWKSKKTYEGAVVIEGVSVTKSTTLEELKTALPDHHFEKKYSAYYEGVFKGLYILVAYNKSDTQITWMAIGKDKN